MTTSSRQPTQQTHWQEQQQDPPSPGQPAGCDDEAGGGLHHAADVNTYEQQQQGCGLGQDPHLQQASQQQLGLPQQQQDLSLLAPQPPPPHQRQDQPPVLPWPAQQQQRQTQQQQQQAQPGWLCNINQPVGELLRRLGLQEYEALLQQQAVDLAALQLMEERHLRELGLPIGAVVKLKAALAAMQ
ncbi:hypothetical protein COO60DRAFT_745416 [Scenedesmus sp. NREL 46B-D3]|nr:hypothetical protein COO60DRAFT_745416 [Scenedesmus sp. NREL 46B-D3]